MNVKGTVTKTVPIAPEVLASKDPSAYIGGKTLGIFTVEMMADNMIQVLVETVALYAYNGFNPEETYKALKQYAMIAGVNDADFMKLIMKIVAFGVARGTKIITKGASGSKSAEAVRDINSIVEIFHIQDNVPLDGDKGAHVITISRVLNTFPTLVGSIYSKGLAQPIGSKSIIPLALMFPGGASLIPSGMNGLFEAFLDWSVDFDRVVNRLVRKRSDESFDPVKSREEQRNWAEIARGSSLHSDEARLVFLKKWANTGVNAYSAAKYDDYESIYQDLIDESKKAKGKDKKRK